MSIAVVGGEIVVSGIALDSSVALFGVVHRTEDFHAALERVDLVVQGDASGEAHYECKPPATSLWFAVNLDTQELVMTPGDPEFVPATLPVPKRTVDAFSGATIGVRFAEREAVELLLVRFGSGLWSLTGNDGGSGEVTADPDGNLDIPVASFANPGESLAAPDSLVANDLLLAVDSRSLEWAVSDVGSLAPEGE